VTRRGFTLVEVVVVLAILAVVLGIAIPRLVAPSTPERAAARAIADALTRAGILAVERDEPVTVELDTSTGAWAIVSTTMGDTLDSATITERTVLGPQDPRIQTVRFDPLGRAAGPVLTVGTTGRQHLVRVDGWTSAVSIATR